MSNVNSLRPPKYRRHKAKGLAVVTIAGRDVYLGRYGSAASKEQYRRLIAEYLMNGANGAAATRVGATAQRLGEAAERSVLFLAISRQADKHPRRGRRQSPVLRLELFEWHARAWRLCRLRRKQLARSTRLDRLRLVSF